MKAYDITKLTADLESDNVQYINRIHVATDNAGLENDGPNYWRK